MGLSVRRQPAHQPAAPKCHTPSPRGLPVLRRPASGFAPWQATAQASRSRGWRRHCLAFWPSPATVEPSLSSAKQTFRQANGLEHPVQHAAEVLGFSQRSNRPWPNRLFKGTSTRFAVCRPLTPALGLPLTKYFCHMNIRGWVYVLSNKAMPGLVKIGFSTKDPALRVNELNGTGLPHAFDIEYDVLTLDPRETEQDVHRRLAPHREAKEFFRVNPQFATQTIRDSINHSCKPFIAESQREADPTAEPEKTRAAASQTTPPHPPEHKTVFRPYANTCPVCKIDVEGKDSRCPKCFAFLS
jgi:hypothetical protein